MTHTRETRETRETQDRRRPAPSAVHQTRRNFHAGKDIRAQPSCSSSHSRRRRRASTAATATIPSVVMAADGVAADTSKIRNFDMIEAFYREYPKKLAVVRGTLNRPLTLTERSSSRTSTIRKACVNSSAESTTSNFARTAPARMTSAARWPSFSSSPRARNWIPPPVPLVCDHLVQANVGAIPDLKVAEKGNVETYEFLRDVLPAATALTSGPPAPASAIRSSWKTTTSRVT